VDAPARGNYGNIASPQERFAVDPATLIFRNIGAASSANHGESASYAFKCQIAIGIYKNQHLARENLL
jgi:hypothetical protein